MFLGTLLGSFCGLAAGGGTGISNTVAMRGCYSLAIIFGWLVFVKVAPT